MYVCMYVFMYVCIYVCIYIYMCVCICVCIYAICTCVVYFVCKQLGPAVAMSALAGDGE